MYYLGGIGELIFVVSERLFDGNLMYMIRLDIICFDEFEGNYFKD